MNTKIPHLSLPKSSLTAVSLFAGAGGFALGLENAGFTHSLLSEIDPKACATLRANRPHWPVVEGDVAGIDYSPFRGRTDVVEGGFPCQPFSYGGARKGLLDVRGTLFYEFARAIRDIMPKVFIAENVKGLITHDKGATFRVVMDVLSGISDPATGAHYRVSHCTVSASDFDVPQKRDRVFIVGVRSDVYAEPLALTPSTKHWTLRDAIADAPDSPGSNYSKDHASVFTQVPAGGCWRDLPVNVQKEFMGSVWGASGGRTSIARRLAWDAPSPTLTCSPTQKFTGLCHPEHTRPLNVREYARIQTFPDSWVFTGPVTSQYKQIGNAVPVNLGFHWGRVARSAIEAGLARRAVA